MGSGSSSAKNKTAPSQPPPQADAEPEQPTVDSRLPFANFREVFTLKNFWKTIRRNEADCAKRMLARYISKNNEHKGRYAKLKNVDVSTIDAASADPGFEALAQNYLKVFDDVISAIEEKPGDVQAACDRLAAVGRMHRAKVADMESGWFQLMEEPFLHMVSEVLQDRYNEKAETLFRKFFQFCLKHLLEGYAK